MANPPSDSKQGELLAAAGEGPLRIVLIDAANSLYRAFFALPPMRNPAGEPTNAVLGFANMLQKVIREEQPDRLAVIFDAKGTTFRHELYPEYKAGRDAQAEDLSLQFPMARELVEVYGLPWIMEEGVEADDVIATLVKQAPADSQVTIISTDKDLMQLVSERVQLLDTMKDRRYDPAEVEGRFGVPPEQLLDLRSLVGDPSDNIPGVKGIGQKGAANLIKEWGTLENLLAHAGEVKAKRAREALLAQADAARLSKVLSTLKMDVPLELSIEALRLREPDVDALRAKLQHLGFMRLLAKLSPDGRVEDTAVETASAIIEVAHVTDAKGLSALTKKLSTCHAIWMLPVVPEEGLFAAPLVGLALALSEEEVAYVPLAHRPSQDSVDPGAQLEAREVVGAIAALLSPSGGAIPWCATDAKAVWSAFAELGHPLPPAHFDLGIAAFLVDPSGAHTLPSLAAAYLGRSVPGWEELAGRGAKAVPAAELPVEKVAQWAGQSAACALALREKLDAKVREDELSELFEKVEMPLTGVLARIEREGVRIDEALLEKLSHEYEILLAKIEAEIFELAGEEFKVNSPKQLQVILFEKLGLSPGKRTKTGYSTDEAVLQELSRAHPLPERVLAYRHLAKLKSTYIDALPPLVNPHTGRIHPTLLQTGAATGRLACAHPNLQNIPIRTEEGARIRTAFIPAEGMRLLCADYSQVELRILAHYSKDESLLEAFRKGEDIHRRTAAEVLGIEPEDVTPEDRAQAKAVNFGIIYGSSAFGLANQLGIPNYAAQQYIDSYFERYEGVRSFLDETLVGAKERGFVQTLLGRRRYLPDLASRNRVQRQAAERMAVNTVVQGTAADLIKKAMVAVDLRLQEGGYASRVILQVHDELVLEVPASEEGALRELLTEEMEGVWALRVPLRIDIGVGANWREAH